MNPRLAALIAALLLAFTLLCEAGGSDYMSGAPTPCSRTTEQCAP